jgi:hypothetical protein
MWHALKRADKHEKPHQSEWASLQYRFLAVKKKDSFRPFSH